LWGSKGLTLGSEVSIPFIQVAWHKKGWIAAAEFAVWGRSGALRSGKLRTDGSVSSSFRIRGLG
jgi:hypothetical protein